MSLKTRYKIYVILALAFCAAGVGLNISTESTAGFGSLLITAGGISLVLGITLKRKAQEIQDPTDEDLSTQ